MMKRRMKRALRTVLDPLLRSLDLRLVNYHRAPRGFLDAFSRIKRFGIDIQHIIDIGASDGQWTRQCLSVFPRATYFLIEARDVHAAALSRLQHHHPNIRFRICAVGAEPRLVTLYEHGNQTSVLNSEYADRPHTRRREVVLQTVDSLLPPNGLAGPAIVKLDVQGYESEVLHGSTGLLTTLDVQFLLAEVSFRRIYDSSPLAHDLIRHVAEDGFRIFDICSYCPRPHDLELGQCDILFGRETCQVFDYEGWE